MTDCLCASTVQQSIDWSLTVIAVALTVLAVQRLLPHVVGVGHWLREEWRWWRFCRALERRSVR